MPYFRIENLRAYLGITYIFHIDPKNLGKDSYEVGIEYFLNDLLAQNITPFVGYDFKLVNFETYHGNNSLNLGIKFGWPRGRGLSIYFNYYAGRSVHGEYYEFSKEYSAIGINIDL